MSGYAAFNLTESAKTELLGKYPPKFSKVIAHHVTYRRSAKESDPIPEVDSVRVIGYCSNEFIECMVVRIGPDLLREDGKIYHITLSHAEGHKPVESNALLTSVPWEAIDPFYLEVKPAFNK